MAIKYHNSPQGPRLCKAEVRECKYGVAGGAHYETQAEAWAAYEEKMTSAFGLLPKQSAPQRELQKIYNDIDNVRWMVTKVKSAPQEAKAAALFAGRSLAQRTRGTRSSALRQVRAFVQAQNAKVEARYAEARGEGWQERTFTFPQEGGEETFLATPQVLQVTKAQLRSLQRLMGEAPAQDLALAGAPRGHQEEAAEGPRPGGSSRFREEQEGDFQGPFMASAYTDPQGPQEEVEAPRGLTFSERESLRAAASAPPAPRPRRPRGPQDPRPSRSLATRGFVSFLSFLSRVGRGLDAKASTLLRTKYLTQ